jgi:hypothetical protein
VWYCALIGGVCSHPVSLMSTAAGAAAGAGQAWVD